MQQSPDLAERNTAAPIGGKRRVILVLDGVNAREKEKPINLTGVNRRSRTHCIMHQQTSQYKCDTIQHV